MDKKELEKIRKEFQEYIEFTRSVSETLDDLMINLYHKQREHNKKLREILKVLEEINEVKEKK